MEEITELPTLIGEKLVLRPIKLEDCSDMYEYAKLDNVGPNAGWRPHTSIEETKKIIEIMISQKLTNDNIGVFSIVLKKDMKMIGTIGLHKYDKANSSASLGYVLNPKYWGQGIMVAALNILFPWIFNTLNIYRLECGHFDFNNRSKRVIEKMGFTYEGCSRKKILLPNGNRCDLLNYSLLKDEYTKKLL